MSNIMTKHKKGNKYNQTKTPKYILPNEKETGFNSPA